MINIIEGDLLDNDELVIVHQCNCVSIEAKGLAKSIFDIYPGVNIYQSRTKDLKTYSYPGTVTIYQVNNKNNNNLLYIVNLYGQVYPGKPRCNLDLYSNRLQYFKNGLNSMIESFKYCNISIDTIAMPYNIGCGLAGGNWDDYFKIITEFSTTNNIKVNLYKK